MLKSYLTIDRGLLEETLFPLEKSLSIGRVLVNDLILSDLTVSRHHAKIYRKGDQFVVEDFGSSNGTLVNGVQIKKAFLSDEDTLKLGNVVLRFQQKDKVAQKRAELTNTQAVTQPEMSEALPVWDLSRPSRRLIQALSQNPLFSGISAEDLVQVSQMAQLVIVDRGKTIIQKGDRVRSLTIVLDGKVRVFTHDHQAMEIPLAVLTENRFFGETSLLTGDPSSTVVQAVEETLLCRMSYEAMRLIMEEYPIIKGTLGHHYQKTLKDMEAKKTAAGFVERRKHPRFNMILPVRFSISPTPHISDQFEGEVFESTSSNLSISGIRINVPDPSILTLPMGCRMGLEISLHEPWGSVRCQGTLRNVVEMKEGEGLGYLGIEFAQLSLNHRRKLRLFLST